MPQLPPNAVLNTLQDLELLRRGKVRDTYALPGHDDKLFVVASDRVSIFDFVLAAEVPLKGAILTATNHFWRTQVLKDAFESDLIAAGGGIDEYLPEMLRSNTDLQARATVVKKLNMIPIEAIVRNHLTGTGLKAYNETQQVCGHRLPKGLQDGDKLPYLLFTPTTKADVGHDEHVTAESVADEHGFKIERTSIQVFSLIQQFAGDRGIILADTKFEFGRDPSDAKKLVLGDEVATPDSSRYWDVEAWQEMQKKEKRKSPASFDKQYVREWGITIGINKRDPLVAEDVAWVHAQEVPEDIINETAEIYQHIFFRLTGRDLRAYQKEFMNI